jgi:hypothetical protein
MMVAQALETGTLLTGTGNRLLWPAANPTSRLFGPEAKQKIDSGGLPNDL